MILRDGKVLLARRGRAPHRGEWDLVGGFVDAGETVPAAARREVREETGLQLHDLRRLHQAAAEYVPGTPTLNFVYVAQADGEPHADDDVAELRWFALDEIPPLAWSFAEEAVRRLTDLPRAARDRPA